MISFSNSRLCWLTKKQSSYGFFQLDAILDCRIASFPDPFRFVLASSVPAGRMYERSGPLVRDPAYSFQMIAGLDEHTVLRRDLLPEKAAHSFDSTDLHSKHFHDVHWITSSISANSQKLDSLSNISCQSCINIVLEFCEHDMTLRLEVPLRHWNYREHPKAWQIETGPLLWPFNTYDFSHFPQSSGLTTAWLHANKDNRVTISGDRLVAHELDAQLSLLVSF